MCGIAGAWLGISAEASRSAVVTMCNYMARRGPDAEGEWTDPEERLSLGHRRLAIIDLEERSNQPMASADGRFVITFNGEIYNYKSLRQQLIDQGVGLRTTSDTEVILELYRRYGVAAFCMLRGMFAFGIWDADNRSLVLVRDPYGIKPLYVAETADGVMFASQVKALAATGHDLGGLDPAGMTGFFVWGSVPEPFTLHKRVRAVPAGGFIVATPDGLSSPTAFAELGSAWEAPAVPEDVLNEVIREAVLDSVGAHLVSDVPVAVLLSGGIDSGVISALMAQLGQDAEGITVKFDEFAGTDADESIGARLISQSCGLRHAERKVDRREFMEDLPAIFAAMDQPTVDGVNTWFAAKAVAERGYKVVLSGVGGDELFCGYDTFRNLPRIRGLGHALPKGGPLLTGVEAAFSFAAGTVQRPKLQWLPRHSRDLGGAYTLQRAVFMPDELGTLIDPDVAREGWERLRNALPEPPTSLGSQAEIAFLESTRYLRNQLLRDTDWASMAHSLEMRTPLADWTLLRRLGPYVRLLGRSRGKRMLAAAPLKPLPSAIVRRRKTGFGLPMQRWLADAEPGLSLTEPGQTAPWARSWAVAVGKKFGLETSTNLERAGTSAPPPRARAEVTGCAARRIRSTRKPRARCLRHRRGPRRLGCRLRTCSARRSCPGA